MTRILKGNMLVVEDHGKFGHDGVVDLCMR